QRRGAARARVGGRRAEPRRADRLRCDEPREDGGDLRCLPRPRARRARGRERAMTAKTRVAFLLSGSGTTLENLLRHADMGAVPAEVDVVVADRPGTGGIERAKKRGIATAVVDAKAWKDPLAFESAVSEALRPHAPDLVAMGGFLRL